MDRTNSDGPTELVDAKSEVARTLIEAMRAGNTPWQRPWSGRALCPVGSTGRPYQGVNRLLLSIAGADIAARLGAPPDPRWTTYAQAAANGWQVRRGERGSPIVKVVELGERTESGARATSGEAGRVGDDQSPTRRALRRYVVFNAAQVDGMPPPEPEEAPSFEPVARAEIASACLAAETGAPVVAARPAAHIERHAAYLNSWIKAIERDPNAIFAAARGAETVCAYLLGLEREIRRGDEIERWAEDYRREEARLAER